MLSNFREKERLTGKDVITWEIDGVEATLMDGVVPYLAHESSEVCDLSLGVRSAMVNTQNISGSSDTIKIQKKKNLVALSEI